MHWSLARWRALIAPPRYAWPAALPALRLPPSYGGYAVKRESIRDGPRQRVTHSDTTLREPFMHVHTLHCISIHVPLIAVPRSAVPCCGCSPSRAPTRWLTHADPLMVRLPTKP